LPQNCF